MPSCAQGRKVTILTIAKAETLIAYATPSENPWSLNEMIGARDGDDTLYINNILAERKGARLDNSWHGESLPPILGLNFDEWPRLALKAGTKARGLTTRPRGTLAHE